MYNKVNWVLETHWITKDVHHKDYGKDEPCLQRAIERLLPHLSWEGMCELRVWHDGKCVETILPKYEGRN